MTSAKKARRIVAHPDVMLGKPVFEGTRITVEAVLEALAAGESIEQVLAAYGRLREADIRAALGFAAEAVRAERALAPTGTG